MSIGVLISCVLCVVLAILWALMQRNTTPPASMGNRILFLIAHPDDESMFFSPLMFALKQLQKSPKLFILCLSPGHPRNAPQPNLGTIRTNELLKASKLLGVDECAVEALNDGPNVRLKFIFYFSQLQTIDLFTLHILATRYRRQDGQRRRLCR
jgi:LmbE family N-acetylglucosaminyl deacetylase